MATYRTPGVYVEEISTLPPSVAEVSTAIPAFIGYTEKGFEKYPKVARINTLLEYEDLFGEAKASSFTVKTGVDPDTKQKVVKQVIPNNKSSNIPEFLMYYCVSLYFKNGGGSCYIVSIGNYDSTSIKPDKVHFENGLASLEKEDEPTLILLTDAVNLADSAHYYALCRDALKQCNKLKDRFAILDVLKSDGVEKFRNGEIGTDFLKYGAAYHPYLQTSLNRHYEPTSVAIMLNKGEYRTHANGILVTYDGPQKDNPQVKIEFNSAIGFDIRNKVLTITLPQPGADVAEIVAEWEKENQDEKALFNIKKSGDGSQKIIEKVNETALTYQLKLGDPVVKHEKTDLYNRIKTELDKQRVELPPSPAIAGVYARVDRERGVWKAPANESLSAVIGPVSKITHADQERLNIDPTAGKSINAIRAFTGKGTLIWGARTLAGNDNEWRYVSVRRLFIMIEESTMKSTSFAVFEPNDATTWLKVKGMIESYLYGLWERGALAGSTPEAAYFVNVGLGKTMTAQHVLEGRMIVEIGVAAVRPAEFIIIKFTHKLQEA